MKSFLRWTAALVIALVVGGCVKDKERSVVTLAVDPCDEHTFNDQQKMPIASFTAYRGGPLCAMPDTTVKKLSPGHYTNEIVSVAYVDIEVGDNSQAGQGYMPGRNCIYIGRKNSTGPTNEPAHLTAYVQRVTPANAACPRTLPIGNGTPMMLRDGGAIPPFHRPSVVRIDVTSAGETVIGVACLPNYWCDISKTGVTVAAHTSTNPRRNVKGWYDRQYLGYDHGSGQAQPSPVLATIFPSDELEAATQSSSIFDTWTKVAIIQFDQSVPLDAATLDAYKTKWGFSSTTAITNADEITLHIKYKSPARTQYDAHYMVNGVTGAPRRVDYMADPKKFIAGVPDQAGFIVGITDPAVRWGWDATTGETAWVRCTAGCCQVTSEEDPAPGVVDTAIVPTKKP
jgi:hypothetical protein